LRILAWTAADKYLLGVTNDGRIHKWDVASSRSVDAPVPVASAAMSSISWPRNTDRVASGDQTEVIRILGLDGRQAAPSIVTGDGPATAMIWSPDGTMLASSGSGGSIRIWDVATGAMLGQTEATQNSNWLSLAWRPDGSQLVSGDSRGRVHLWQSLTERRACELVAAKLTVTPLTRALAPVGLESCSNIELLRDFPTIPVLASVGG